LATGRIVPWERSSELQLECIQWARDCEATLAEEQRWLEGQIPSKEWKNTPERYSYRLVSDDSEVSARIFTQTQTMAR